MRGLLIASHPEVSAWDPAQRYRLHPRVALRPEPFGAMAYHYESRRLTFLRSPLLVEVVKGLEDHASVGEAIATLVPPPRRPSFLKALASLAESRFIHPLDPGAPDADR